MLVNRCSVGACEGLEAPNPVSQRMAQVLTTVLVIP